jgi:hypothetical protein
VSKVWYLVAILLVGGVTMLALDSSKKADASFDTSNEQNDNLPNKVGASPFAGRSTGELRNQTEQMVKQVSEEQEAANKNASQGKVNQNKPNTSNKNQNTSTPNASGTTKAVQPSVGSSAAAAPSTESTRSEQDKGNGSQKQEDQGFIRGY